MYQYNMNGINFKTKFEKRVKAKSSPEGVDQSEGEGEIVAGGLRRLG
jgi:hypothetical protein